MTDEEKRIALLEARVLRIERLLEDIVSDLQQVKYSHREAEE